MVKYWYRLRREASAHPVKAVVLAGMCVTAVYYWAPILKRWTGGRPDAPAVAASEAALGTVAHPVAASAAATPAVNWRSLLADARHPLWRPTTVPIHHDPFRRLEPAKPAVSVEPDAEEDQPEDVVDPATAGLRLQATAVGTVRRTAVIDGRAYRVGDRVEVESAERSDQPAYQLVEIETDHVVLERHGKRFELVLEVNQPSRTQFGVLRPKGGR